MKDGGRASGAGHQGPLVFLMSTVWVARDLQQEVTHHPGMSLILFTFTFLSLGTIFFLNPFLRRRIVILRRVNDFYSRRFLFNFQSSALCFIVFVEM